MCLPWYSAHSRYGKIVHAELNRGSLAVSTYNVPENCGKFLTLIT